MTALERIHEMVGSTRSYFTNSQLASLAKLIPGKDLPSEIKLVESKLAKKLIAKNVLYSLVSDGLLATCPPWLLTREALVKHAGRGNTPLHLLAERGELGKLPSQLVTVAMMRTTAGYNATPLHDAAVHNTLDAVPTPLHDAAANSLLWAVPSHLLNSRTLSAVVSADNPYRGIGEENCVAIAVRKGEFPVVVPYLTEELLTCRPSSRFTVFRSNPTSAILLAAKAGVLDQIPPHLLTAAVLKHRSNGDNLPNCGRLSVGISSALHVAATYGGLRDIPNLGEYLMEKAINGKSVVAQAVANHQAGVVRPYMTPEMLETRHVAISQNGTSWDNASLIEIAADCGDLTNLTHVTEDILLKDYDDGTILSKTIETGEFHKLPIDALTMPVLMARWNGEPVAKLLSDSAPRGVAIPVELESLFDKDWLALNRELCTSFKQLQVPVVEATEPSELEMF